MQERINKLKIELNDLINFKKIVEKNQVTYPIDFYSKELIQKDLLVFTGKLAGDLVTGADLDTWVEVIFPNGKIYWLGAQAS